MQPIREWEGAQGLVAQTKLPEKAITTDQNCDDRNEFDCHSIDVHHLCMFK